MMSILWTKIELFEFQKGLVHHQKLQKSNRPPVGTLRSLMLDQEPLVLEMEPVSLP